MSFHSDERAISEVIGVVLLFGILVISFSTYQAYGVPSQNSQIEANHYQEVRGDLTQLQTAAITAAETGEARAATIDLGPRYSARIIAVNAGPPSGQLSTAQVGSGEIVSSSIPMNDICRLEGGTANSVPTKAIVYQPGYNYYSGGDISHRLEETLLYQQAGRDGNALVRANQAMVDTSDRSVTLYPLEANIQATGTDTETVRFVGGYGRQQQVSDATVTIPTQAPAELWEDQLADGNPDVSVTNSGPAEIQITFSGSWTFGCQPVGEGNSPEQLPTAAAGSDTSVLEGETTELDGTGSSPETGISSYSWSFSGTPPSGVTLTDSNTATPVFDASAADVSSDTAVAVKLTVTDEDSNTDTDSVTVEITDTDSISGTTPSLTGDADNLPTDSSTTQRIRFTPTERTIPSGETVTIDLSDPNGGTSSNPDPVKYGDGSITFDYATANQSIITSSGSYIIEWTPATNVPTSRTVTVDITKVKTQATATSGLDVLFSRSDGDGTTTTFALGNGGSNSPPTADFNINAGTNKNKQNLDASPSSDSDGSIDAYDWDLDNDGTYDDASGVAVIDAKVKPGETVSLRVTDNDGATDTKDKTVS